MLSVALVQSQPLEKEYALNRQNISSLLGSSKLKNSGLILLPELFSTGFSPAFKDYTTEEAFQLTVNFKEDVEFLKKLAQTYQSWIMAGVLEASEGFGNYKNLLLSISPEGEVKSLYQKIHPFSFSGEDKAFKSGIRPVLTLMGDLKIQNSICYDLRFPEVYRSLLNAGSNAIAVHANWPVSREEHWHTLLKARAIENQAWVFSVNIVGQLYGTKYFGGSQIISPKGEVLLKADSQVGVFQTEIDETLVTKWREIFPALKDRKKGVMIP